MSTQLFTLCFLEFWRKEKSNTPTSILHKVGTTFSKSEKAKNTKC